MSMCQWQTSPKIMSFNIGLKLWTTFSGVKDKTNITCDFYWHIAMNISGECYENLCPSTYHLVLWILVTLIMIACGTYYETLWLATTLILIMNRYLREFCGAFVFLTSVCGFPMTICDLLTSLSWLVKFGYELFYELYGPTYECLWLN